jgi:hypothetical protein
VTRRPELPLPGNRSLLGYGRPAFATGALALAVFLAYDGVDVEIERFVIAGLAVLAAAALGWWLIDRRR